MKKMVFNLNEACEYLGVSKSTMYKLTSTRTISFKKPNGGKIYFYEDDLIQWIEKKTYSTKESMIKEKINQLKEKNYGK